MRKLFVAHNLMLKRLFVASILAFFFSLGMMAFERHDANATMGAQVDSTQLKRGLKEVKLGESELKDSNYEKAKLHFVNALDIFTQLNERVLIADMYKHIAWMDRYNNENQLEVIEYYKKAAEIFLE